MQSTTSCRESGKDERSSVEMAAGSLFPPASDRVVGEQPLQPGRRHRPLRWIVQANCDADAAAVNGVSDAVAGGSEVCGVRMDSPRGTARRPHFGIQNSDFDEVFELFKHTRSPHSKIPIPIIQENTKPATTTTRALNEHNSTLSRI